MYQFRGAQKKKAGALFSNRGESQTRVSTAIRSTTGGSGVSNTYIMKMIKKKRNLKYSTIIGLITRQRDFFRYHDHDLILATLLLKEIMTKRLFGSEAFRWILLDLLFNVREDPRRIPVL